MMKKIFSLFFFLCINFYAQTDFVVHIPDGNISGIDVWQNEVWIATYGRGIFKYDKTSESIEEFSSAKGNLVNDFFYCIAASKDFIWAGTSDGLFTYDRKKKSLA